MTWTRPDNAPHPGGDHLPACWVREWEEGGSIVRGEVRQGKHASDVQCHPDCLVWKAITAVATANVQTF